MNCPHCGNSRTVINRTERKDGTSRRYRVCLGCARSFTTIETAVVFTGDGYTEMPAQQNRALSTSYRKLVLPSDLWGLPDQLAQDLAHWWQTARWSKHGNKAVWTQRAFEASLRRVQQLHAVNPARAAELVQQGIERGWQALDPKFLDPPAVRMAAAASRLGPQSPRMQSALDRWNDPL